MVRVSMLATVAVVISSSAFAQASVVTLDAIEVVPSSPLAAPDTGAERAKYPAAATTIGASDLADTRQPELAQALERRAPGVSIVDVTGNPFQPEVDYRGFSACNVFFRA